MLDGWCEWWMSLTLREVSEVFSVAVAILASLIIPYSIVALRIYERDPRVARARRDPQNRLQPALMMAYALTKLFIFGIFVVVANYAIRSYVFHFDTPGVVQPAWSYLLSMVTSLVVLVLLFAPSLYLLRIKMWALNRAVARSDSDGRGS